MSEQESGAQDSRGVSGNGRNAASADTAGAEGQGGYGGVSEPQGFPMGGSAQADLAPGMGGPHMHGPHVHGPQVQMGEGGYGYQSPYASGPPHGMAPNPGEHGQMNRHQGAISQGMPQGTPDYHAYHAQQAAYAAQAGYLYPPPPGMAAPYPSTAYYGLASAGNPHGPPPGMGQRQSQGGGPGMAEVMEEIANGGNGLSSLGKMLNFDDSEFWKGALVGAAAVLLLTNESIQSALFKAGVKAKDVVEKGADNIKAAATGAKGQSDE